MSITHEKVSRKDHETCFAPYHYKRALYDSDSAYEIRIVLRSLLLSPRLPTSRMIDRKRDTSTSYDDVLVNKTNLIGAKCIVLNNALSGVLMVKLSGPLKHEALSDISYYSQTYASFHASRLM